MCIINNLDQIRGSSLFQAGVRFFNAGDYFEAHEVWEDLWRSVEAGELRTFYQGLIHAAVGLHHRRRGNATGARSQLTKAIQKLGQGQAVIEGIQVAELIAKLEAARDGAEAEDIRI